MKALKIIGGVVGVLAVALAGFVITRPDTAHYERSLLIEASPEVIIPHVDDMSAFHAWSPYAAFDPEAKVTFAGPARGVGSSYAWDGEKIGKGSLTVTDVTPTVVKMDLDFIAPFAAKNVTTFTLKPSGTSTTVTWSMDGENTTMGKVMSLFMDMDKIMGDDFTKGLASRSARIAAAR